MTRFKRIVIAAVLFTTWCKNISAGPAIDHWAWKPPARPTLPKVKNKAWPKNPIDLFILSRLETAGLKPSPPASRERLIRRVTFDLIGLPPTPQEIDAFATDKSPNAYEKVLDRLLASPHYGERWARHWLDVARFAESNGFEFDELRPDAWRYRDYVIESFNSDKPYDRFIKEQIAGDELYPNDSPALIATGFNLLGPDMTDASDQKQRRQNTLNDMTDTAGLAFLGMTIACARCHDHKFEPIPQTDYYRLQAFFTPTVFRRDLPISTVDQRVAHEAATREYLTLVHPIMDSIAELEKPYRQRLFEQKFARLSETVQAAHRTPEAERSAGQKAAVAETAPQLVVSPQEVLNAMGPEDKRRREELRNRLKEFDNRKPAPLPVAMGLSNAGASAMKTYILERGELSSPGAEVEPGFPSIVSNGNRSAADTSANRIALANWIATKNNPLTARVLVNRLWHHHFGHGIVVTPSDFGTRGNPPTHPELLDWLAVDFTENGWSIKRVHKLMLLSATYRQSSVANPAALKKDPDNKLFSRMNRLRLEGEIIRDSLLAISGELNRKIGGPSVFPPLTADVLQGVKGWNPTTDPRDHVRRSIYIFQKRHLRFPFLETFDLPDSNLSCPKRERSTTAPQSLALLNASDVVQAANAFAERLNKEATTTDGRVVLAYRIALGRRPSLTESKLAGEFLTTSPLSELCRALFNLNEFVYLD